MYHTSDMDRPVLEHNRIVMIAGPSGSGKSTVSRSLSQVYPDSTVVHFDDFQHDADFLSKDEQGYRNWDDPNFTDFELAFKSIKNLKENTPITLMAKNEFDNPNYIKGDHRRKKITVKPSKLCIVEGHYALLDPRIVGLADLSIFLAVDNQISFARRTKLSDVTYDQKYLLPMHDAHVLPTLGRADHVIDVDELPKDEVLDIISKLLEDLTNEC